MDKFRNLHPTLWRTRTPPSNTVHIISSFINTLHIIFHLHPTCLTVPIIRHHWHSPQISLPGRNGRLHSHRPDSTGLLIQDKHQPTLSTQMGRKLNRCSLEMSDSRLLRRRSRMCLLPRALLSKLTSQWTVRRENMQVLAMSISLGLIQHSMQWKYCKVLSSTVTPSTWSPCTTQTLKWCVLPKMDHAADQAYALLGRGTRTG